MNDFLFPIPEIEQLIFEHLNILCDYKNILLVNKHLCQMITNDPIYLEFKELSKSRLKRGRFRYSFQIEFKTTKPNSIFVRACRFGYILVVKYLLQKFPFIDIHHSLDLAFRLACAGGHIEIVKYLFKIDNKINIHALKEYAFQCACIKNRLEVAKFLYDVSGGKINIHESDEFAFRKSCQKGFINVVEYLLSLEKNSYKINIYARDGDAFKLSCKNGYLDIVKLLYSIDEKNQNNGIAYHIDYNSLFWESCKHGHLEIVEFLLLMHPNVNIRIYNDYAFRQSCQYNHTKVAKLLATLVEKNYMLTIENDKILEWKVTF